MSATALINTTEDTLKTTLKRGGGTPVSLVPGKRRCHYKQCPDCGEPCSHDAKKCYSCRYGQQNDHALRIRIRQGLLEAPSDLSIHTRDRSVCACGRQKTSRSKRCLRCHEERLRENRYAPEHKTVFISDGTIANELERTGKQEPKAKKEPQTAGLSPFQIKLIGIMVNRAAELPNLAAIAKRFRLPLQAVRSEARSIAMLWGCSQGTIREVAASKGFATTEKKFTPQASDKPKFTGNF